MNSKKILVQIWNLASGILLRTIKFPSAINAVVVDPGEYSLYAGSTDGRIFVAALNYGVPGATGLVPDGMISFLNSHRYLLVKMNIGTSRTLLIFNGAEII